MSTTEEAVAEDEEEAGELVVRIEPDPDIDNPADSYRAWTPYSFSTKHTNYRHPEELGLSMSVDGNGDPVILNPGLRSKFRAGLAYFLSYYEHGNSVWFLKGHHRPGIEYQWDGVRVAGLLVWEHSPKELPRDKRAKDAEIFLETYTAWCNGDGYYYRVEDAAGEDIDSCGGFYGSDTDYMLDQIRAAVAGRPYRLEGEAAFVAEDVDLSERKEEEPCPETQSE